MGLAIDHVDFKPEDYELFTARLETSLAALRQLLNTPGFGDGELSFGAELELYLIDSEARPLHVNQDIHQQLNDPLLTLELNQYNLEYNFDPVLLSQNCFRATQTQALSALKKINACAQQWGGRVVPIGILPTLGQADVGYHAMTILPRYEALVKELGELRNGLFSIDIEGEDHLQLEMEDVTLEGANTSFQVHLRVPVNEFADTYNALQLVTPLVLALAANSPTLFGHRLWNETRIPLFKQSIDSRQHDPMHPKPARVNFGNGWLRKGALELFAEAVHLYRPILPIISDEEPLLELKEGRIPNLHELRLQQGSIWLWNRPVYDSADGGHLRIEMRALPAGPTIVDMLANAALLIGLTRAVRDSINQLLPAIPFQYCVRNFYRAAELGLAAEMIWPSLTQSEPQYQRVDNILRSLLPQVPDKLEEMGFVRSDYSPLLKIIEERLATGKTGAQWQLDRLAVLEQQLSKPEALRQMVKEYVQHSDKNLPVAQWT